MGDLKRALSALSTLPPPLTPTQKARQANLSAALATLLKDFPDLGTPGSPTDYTPGSPASEFFPSSKSVSTFFFTPARQFEVFARLTVRAGEAGHNTKTRDLVEKCRDIWGIASRREKEKELEGLVVRWGESIGTREEVECGRSVAEGVKDLSIGIADWDPLPPVLTSLLGELLALLSTYIVSIFPTTSVPPRTPPPSILPILSSTPDILLTSPQAVRTLSELSNEIKATAVGEYVSAVGHMMGGVGQDGDAVRRTGESGKDQMVEGFEKVAVWMDKEISGVRKAWGNALGSYVLFPTPRFGFDMGSDG